MNNKSEEITSRAERERQAHNSGLRRGLYTRVFSHSKQAYAKKTNQVITTALKPLSQGKFLEIGSHCWIDWLEMNNIVPDKLFCINISEVELDKGKTQANRSKNKPEFLLMDANKLDFPDNSFDVVYGGSILHHLNFVPAVREIHRVLKPGGIMIFREPLNLNPVGWLVRKATPKARTIDEMPLGSNELNFCRTLFDMQFHYEQFFCVAFGVISALITKTAENPLMKLAYQIDEKLLRLVPSLGPYFRVVTIVGTKPFNTPQPIQPVK